MGSKSLLRITASMFFQDTTLIYLDELSLQYLF